MDRLLFGAAYYDEYMPYERLARDVEMMKRAGVNVVRIAESTWSTCEPQPGVFDFTHVERVMDAMEEAGISVIIGTPTYAVPAWMVKAHPDVLVETKKGRALYGPRQIMDITHPVYLFHAERVIRELMRRTAHRKCVIGFQLDNETKHYGTAGRSVQKRFVKYMREKFHDDLDAMNLEFGFDYWSNRVGAWEDFPDVRGTINGSLAAEFEKFQRMLVTEFLLWQADIVNEYRREDQFVTHNFDYEWRGHSFGVQPDVDHNKAAGCLTIPGVDIYHPSQDQLTGNEIAFGGDMSRALGNGNYLVLETAAQGFPCWTPYDGQLRLQAYSHIASGANSVMYWHWHSLHNACETYWRGVLSHDFEENATYREASVIGNEFARLSGHLVNLKKKNDVAIMVSNESLTALKIFGIQATAGGNGNVFYNDVVRWVYDVLYRMNVECDFIWPECEHLDRYKAVIVPAMYSVQQSTIDRLNAYAQNGGLLIATFKSFFTNENVKVYHDAQPHGLHACMGMTYQQFTFPRNVQLEGESIADAADRETRVFMELLMPTTAETIVSYAHPAWKKYAAVTRNRFGKGTGMYIGCMMSDEVLSRLLGDALSEAGVTIPEERFPLIVRRGENDLGKKVTFYLNYAGEEAQTPVCAGTDLITGENCAAGEMAKIAAWDLKIIEGN